MPLQLVSPIVKVYALDRSDKKYGVKDGEPTTVTIRQASQSQHAKRQQQFSIFESKYNSDPENPLAVSVISKISQETLRQLEVFLTMVECNITDENGSLLFPSRTKDGDSIPSLSFQNENAFAVAWGKLPPDVALEIHEKVLMVNLMWAGAEGEDLSGGNSKS